MRIKRLGRSGPRSLGTPPLLDSNDNWSHSDTQKEPENDLYLKVNINCASDLVPPSETIARVRHKKSVNPVCVVQLNSTKKRTSKKLHTAKPSWDAELSLPLKYGDYSQIVIFSVWDKHKRYKHFLGELRLTVGDIFGVSGEFSPQTDLKWHKLYSNKNYRTFVTGSVLVSFELSSKQRKKSKKRAAAAASQVPTIKVNSETNEKMAQLSVNDKQTAAMKEELDDWIRSLAYPEKELILKPDDQGFYSDSNDITTGLDISDIDSIASNNSRPSGDLGSRSTYAASGLSKEIGWSEEDSNKEDKGVVSNKEKLTKGAEFNEETGLSKTSNWLNIPSDASSMSSITSTEPEYSDVPSYLGIESDSNALSLPTSPEKKKKRTRLKLKKRSKHQDKFSVRNRKVLGVMFVEIDSCSDLPPLRNFTRTSFDMDPFVVVAFGRKTFRTSWKHHTLNPIFNERLAFEVLSHESTFNMQFSVMDNDRFSYHDHVALVELPIKDLIEQGTIRESEEEKDDNEVKYKTEEKPDKKEDNASNGTSLITVVEDDNVIHSVKKNKFSNRKKTVAHYADTSKFRTLNLKLKLEKEKYAEKYNPTLKVRVHFETYANLRREFWRVVLEQYSLNEDEPGKSYDFLELISLLDTLGCSDSDDVVTLIFTRYEKLSWGGDVVLHEEIIDALEEYINDPLRDEHHKIFEIDRCPVCLKKRLHKKDDIDIITHFAICALKDWSIVNKLLVATYVTPQLATKRWFSKILIKLTYGKYQLGSNSANILVQDRLTGIIMEEKMGIYVRLGIRLLYKGLDKAKTKRVRILLKRLSEKQGVKFDSPLLKDDIGSFIKFHRLNVDECLEPDPAKYDTFNEFFYRKLKPGVRPIEAPTNRRIVTSPADCRCAAFASVDSATDLWIKGRNFTVAKLFGGNLETFESPDFFKADKCALGVFRLAPQDYHRFHSPVEGTIQKIKYISGEYYTVNPMAIRSELDVFGENVRVIIPIKTKDFGTVMMIAVGAMMVGSTVLTVGEGDEVKRGDEVGYFKFGGSTIILLFESKYFQFDSDLINNSLARTETLIRVGQSVGHAPGDPEYQRDHIDFEKQSKEFKMKLIRVLTGGDINAKELGSWESNNIQLTQEDLDTIVREDAEANDNDFDVDGPLIDEEGLCDE